LTRSADTLTLLDTMNSWVSPRLGIRFELTDDGLALYRPDGERFLTYVELGDLLESARAERQQDQQRIQTLETKLRELGIDPESV